jgi:hypothetical protein
LRLRREITMKTPLQNVCSLDAGALAERAALWAGVRDQALQSAERTENGARLVYARSAEMKARLDRLVQAERECCAVGGVDWRLEEAKDTLMVHVTTPANLRDSPEARMIFAVIGGTYLEPDSDQRL